MIQSIAVTLLSDATFASGEPSPGEVHVEIDSDEFGLPFLRGRTLRGLLRDTWLTMAPAFPELHHAALRVLGPPGDVGETAILRIGDARIEAPLRDVVARAIAREQSPLTPGEILASLTDIRVQSAENRESGGAESGTLRMTRVLLRDTVLHASLGWLATPLASDLRCLALAAVGTRHAGNGRNRGRGHVLLSLDGNPAATLRIARGGAT